MHSKDMSFQIPRLSKRFITHFALVLSYPHMHFLDVGSELRPRQQLAADRAAHFAILQIQNTRMSKLGQLTSNIGIKIKVNIHI